MQAWAPSTARHIDQLEAVQRHATKLIPNFRDLQYSERLKKLNLPSLQFRRLRGDMIETFKYVHNYNKCDQPFTPQPPTATRGHPFKLRKERAQTNIRFHFFGHRVVNVWNSLPSSVVSAPSVNSFKSRLDAAWKNHPDKFQPRIHQYLTWTASLNCITHNLTNVILINVIFNLSLCMLGSECLVKTVVFHIYWFQAYIYLQMFILIYLCNLSLCYVVNVYNYIVSHIISFRPICLYYVH